GAHDSNAAGMDSAVQITPPLLPPPPRGGAALYTGRRTAHKGAIITPSSSPINTPATHFSGVSGSVVPAREGASLVASTSRGGLAFSPLTAPPIMSDEEDRLAAAQRRLASVQFSGASNDESQARAEAAEQRQRDAEARGRVRQAPSVVDIQPQSLFNSPARDSAPRLPSTVGAPATPPSTQFYSLGLEVASSAGISADVYSTAFIRHLHARVRQDGRRIGLIDAGQTRIVNISSINIENGNVHVHCSRPQIPDDPTVECDVTQLLALPFHDLGVSYQSVSSLQPLTDYFRRAYTRWCAQSIQSGCSSSTSDMMGAVTATRPSFGRGRSASNAGAGNPLARFNSATSSQSLGYMPSYNGGRDVADDYDANGDEYDAEADNGLLRRFPDRQAGANDNPFKRWDPKKVKKYEGSCKLGTDLSDVTSMPHLWLDDIAATFNFYGIPIRYWAFGALQCVTKEIQELYKQTCRESPALWQVPWDNVMHRLQNYDDIRADGTLPDQDPMSWAVFSAWLKFQFTSADLVRKQLQLIIHLRQKSGRQESGRQDRRSRG
ncbi:MAG: hypothetical protein ACPIOQ_30905, partial [Promethearchaeia archaeon]